MSAGWDVHNFYIAVSGGVCDTPYGIGHNDIAYLDCGLSQEGNWIFQWGIYSCPWELNHPESVVCKPFEAEYEIWIDDLSTECTAEELECPDEGGPLMIHITGTDATNGAI